MPFAFDDINRIAAQILSDSPGLFYHEPECPAGACLADGVGRREARLLGLADAL
jgi:hypothetical protein